MIRIQVVATGEVGAIHDESPTGPWLLRLDVGGERWVDGGEQVRVLLPDWDLAPPIGAEVAA